MNIVGVVHAGLLVENTARTLGFYQGVLGLQVDDARPDLGYPGAWLQVWRQQIHLVELPNPDLTQVRPALSGHDRHFAWTITELETFRHTLETAGISYTLSRSGRRALFCRDPDGNALEFIEQH